MNRLLSTALAAAAITLFGVGLTGCKKDSSAHSHAESSSGHFEQSGHELGEGNVKEGAKETGKGFEEGYKATRDQAKHSVGAD